MQPQIKIPTRGFNLPDWLATDPRAPSDTVLEKLRAIGFETIRLPLDPRIVTADFTRHVAGVLATVTTKGFNAILDLHPGGDFTAADAAAAWKVLAPVIADTSTANVYAELLNEPPMDAAAWASLRDDLAGIVRAAAPEHTLIWGPARVQGIWELANAKPLPDPNAIVAVHYYTPMGFTHQCENWDDSPLARIKNLPFPATRDTDQVTTLAASLDTGDRAFLDGEFKRPWTIANIAADFAEAGAWAKGHGVPMMLGEFGVLNFCVDPASRGNWVRAVRQAAEANGLGWASWEADQGFGFIVDRTSPAGFDASMLEALLT
jgi:endoglucanase